MERAAAVCEVVIPERGYDLPVHFAGYAVEVPQEREPGLLVKPRLDARPVRDDPIQNAPS